MSTMTQTILVTGGNSGFGRLIVEALAHLVAQPAGTRPLRTIVATASQSSYPQEINATAERATREYLESLGVLPLITLAEKE